MMSQCHSLVRADNSEGAEGLDAWQLLDDGVALRHAAGAHGQHDGEKGREAVGDHGDRDRDGGLEGLLGILLGLNVRLIN